MARSGAEWRRAAAQAGATEEGEAHDGSGAADLGNNAVGREREGGVVLGVNQDVSDSGASDDAVGREREGGVVLLVDGGGDGGRGSDGGESHFE